MLGFGKKEIGWSLLFIRNQHCIHFRRNGQTMLMLLLSPAQKKRRRVGIHTLNSGRQSSYTFTHVSLYLDK